MQIKHWDAITRAEFHEGYVQSVTGVGEVHHRLGLEPRWYIGGYSFSTGLSSVAARRKKAKMLETVTKAAMLDMDLAISFYLDAGRREKRHMLDELSASFQRSIAMVAGEVVAVAGKLEAAAHSLTATAGETEQRALTAASGSEKTLGNVRSVADAAKSLTCSIHEINRQAQDSAGRRR